MTKAVKPKKNNGRTKGGKVGQPTKYTPEIVLRTKELLELGLNYQDICDSIGISAETFSQWRKKYPEYSEVVRIANAKVKEIALKSIRVGEMRDWKAAAWRLERRWPDEYKDKKELEITKPSLVMDMFDNLDDDDTKQGKRK
jgi:hypothetical protein